VLSDSISTASIKYGSRTVSITNEMQMEVIVVPFTLCRSWMRLSSLVPRLQMYLLYQGLVINEYGALMEWSVALLPPKTLHALQCDRTRSLRCEDGANLLHGPSRRQFRLALSTKCKLAVNFLTINTKYPKQIHKDRVF